MSPELVGVLGLACLGFLMLARVPVALCFGIVGFLGSVYFVGFKPAVSTLGLYAWSQTVSYTMMALPMFVLMGEYISFSGLGRDLYDLFHKWIGHARGGLALTTIASCAAFAAISGSSLAGVLTMGAVAYPQMRRYGYDKKLAAGSIATAGTLAIMIPPSTLFIIYATMTEVSVGRLFIAGILPGLLLAVALMSTVFLRTALNPRLAPPTPAASWGERLHSLPTGGFVVALFALIMGGIYLGWFTATEASAVGAVLALVFTIARKRLTGEGFLSSMGETALVTGMIFLIIIMANYYGYFLALTRLPSSLASFVAGLPLPPLLLVGVIMAIYIPLGCVMEVLAMLVLTIPIFFPTVVALGFSPIWFGILVTLMCELAQITPPVGLAVFVMKGVATDMTTEEVFMGTAPFVVTIVAVLVILLLFPQISLFLPSLMK